MEVAEKFAHRTDQFIPFGLHRAANSELYCAASRTKVYVLELNYSHHCDERIFMEQSVLSDISKFMPSHGVPRNAASIFNRAAKPEQDRLLVDYHLMTEELKVSSERVAVSQVRWSMKQPNLPGKHYLAYLTNFGGCEIRQKHTGKLSWCFTVHNIAKEWMMHCQKSIKYALNTFETFEEAVYSIKITAISWNNTSVADTSSDQNLDLCFVTANGNVVFYHVGDTLELKFQKQVNHKQVNTLEWFTFNDKHNCKRSYLIACERNGVISLLGVQYDCNSNIVTNVCEIVELFNERDGVCANGIQWEYCEHGNQLIFVICKGMHIFSYLFSIDNETVLSSCIHYVGHLTINGISRRKPMEYVVGTLNGHIECVRLNIQSNAITMESEELKQPNGHSKYALYGLAISTNNAFLLLAYFAGRPYDHLSLREPGHIAVCHQLGGQTSLEVLLNNPTKSLLRTQDLAESIRCAQVRSDKIFKNYFDTYPTEIVCTDEYVYKLKVRLIVTSARSTYLRLKNRLIESGNLLGEYNVVKRFIYAIQSYKILTYLCENIQKLNEFQIISAQCHRTSLYDFLNLSIFEEYEAIKVQFHPEIEKILTATDDIDKRGVEKCAYCDAPVDRLKGVCEQEHDLARCCISMIQVPMMNQRQCTQCQSIALDDLTKLKQILPTIDSDDEPICPLCDIPMIRPHLTFAEYPD